jgi:hypothetical protein
MKNPEITVALAVIAVAVAQLLTIFLTIGRERDIKELRKRVDGLEGLLNEQRLKIVELKAWLAGRNAAQLGRLESKRKPISEPIANNIEASKPAIPPKDLAEATEPRITEDKAAKLGQADSDVPSSPAQWPIEDLRRHVARLKAGDVIQPTTADDELERANKAINWLKEESDKSGEIDASLHDTPPGKIG